MSQLCLFASPAQPERSSLPSSSPSSSLGQIARTVLDRRSRVHGQVHACANCHCTEDNPCRTAEGETCILNVRTGYCSGAKCLKAAARANGRVA